MNARRIVRVLAAALAVAASAAAFAQAYKWTDENGKVHFSDSPPPDRKSQPLVIRPSVPANPGTAPGLDWQAQLEQSRLRQLQAQQQKDADDRNARIAENDCKRARYRLDQLTNGHRIFSVDKDGQRQYLDDKDRPAQIQAAQQEVARRCR